MSDWMDNELSTQRHIEEREKERRRRESDKWSRKWDRMGSAASSKIDLLKKVVSEFGEQTGYKSNVDESHEIDKAHWTKNDWITKWIYATAHYYIKKQGFEVSILVREPFLFFGPKVWAEFRYTRDYYSRFCTSATEYGLKTGFKRMFKMATR